MAKHISRRRIPSRNIRQIAQPPEISAKEINAAPPNAQNDDYHSENNWNNDDVVNQAEIGEEIDENVVEGHEIDRIDLDIEVESTELK